MPAYTVVFKEDIIRKILSTDKTDSIITISENTGVSTRTIRRWVKRHREVVLANTGLTKNDKIKAVCRKNGIMPEELEE
jgi:transposase-like protein